jgi:hypothetical protein
MYTCRQNRPTYCWLLARLRVDGVAHALAHHEVADLVGSRAPPAGRPRLLRGAVLLAVEADGARQRQQRPGQRAADTRRHHRGRDVVAAERALVHHPRRPPTAPPPHERRHAPHDGLAPAEPGQVSHQKLKQGTQLLI